MNALVVDGFYPRANDLRAVFDQRFGDPLRAHGDRFRWDYWHVPGEYTALRTPAYHYFPKRTYDAFHRYLVEFGRRELGCHDISPPWLSCYIEGCRQEPHQDVPHGPLAFVFSLTNWRTRKFRGGETFISRPRMLIESKFNRLTLFNPSLTHGVRTVRGTHDPREGRLVIHGWFVNPRPFWVGPLDADQVRASLDGGLRSLFSPEDRLGEGLFTVRLKIDRAGTVRAARPLINTLRLGSAAHQARLVARLRALKFPRTRSSTELTLPLIIR